MASAHMLYDDQGTLVNLLTTTPWDVKLLLRQSIGRWQMLRIVSHMQPIVGNPHGVWRRALRNSVLSLKNPIHRGCARRLLGSALWPPARKKALGISDSHQCEM
eukprot:25052-Pyramimonas_sp.AAC.1